MLPAAIIRFRPDFLVVDAGDFPACCQAAIDAFPRDRVVVIEDHRAGPVHIHPISIPARIAAVFGAVAIDPERPQIGRALRLRPGLAFLDLGILGKGQLYHVF